MLFSDLQKIATGDSTIHQDLEVSRFSTDSRTLSGSTDEVFIAINGKRDGHNFVKAAHSSGIKNFIVEKPIDLTNCNILLVRDSIAAFHKIAKAHRAKHSMPVVGITGSNGKTTVKEWLFTLLSERDYVVKNPKSYNSQIGVPLSILEIRQNHDIGIFEAGISQVGEMKRLETIIRPTVGVFTTLGQAHNEGFDSMEQKLKEKLKLFIGCENVISRSDKEYSEGIRTEFGDRLVTWSLDGTGDYLINWNNGIQINDHHFQVDFTDPADLENVTHAIVTSLYFELDKQAIQAGLNQIRAVPMRLELKKGINGSYILDDSYNNDLGGLKVALDYMGSHSQNEYRTVILSDILQSGMSDPELYAIVSKQLSEKKVNRLIGIGPRISACSKLFEIETVLFDSTDELISNLPSIENEMILIKGARDFQLERVVKLLEERLHGTVLEVNFEALLHNLNQYRNLISPPTKLMVMVKANAYGSGLLEVANFLEHHRVDKLGVAYVDEAIQLRKSGIQLPIMIMNPHIESFEEFERYDLQAEIFSLSYLYRLLKDTSNPPVIHLKIDTGMHRLGFSEEDIPSLIEVLKENPSLRVEGIFTHFSSSDAAESDPFTQKQAELFDRLYEQLANALGYRPLKHACNSSGIVRWPQFHYDMVRLGIGLHGFDPTGMLQLRSTSRLRTTISQIQHLKKGEAVGYSRKGLLSRDSRIAVIAIGYEDGYLRTFGNGRASVLINGKLCPTIGNVCMDMTMIDVTDIEASEGDEVIIFGDNPKISNLASWAETIPYEILTNVSSRVKRVFVSE